MHQRPTVFPDISRLMRHMRYLFYMCLLVFIKGCCKKNVRHTQPSWHTRFDDRPKKYAIDVIAEAGLDGFCCSKSKRIEIQ